MTGRSSILRFSTVATRTTLMFLLVVVTVPLPPAASRSCSDTSAAVPAWSDSTTCHDISVKL